MKQPHPHLLGFSFIELIVSTAVLTILLSIGLPISLSFLRTYGVQSERDTVMSLLEWARDGSLTNDRQNSHGVKITANQYIGFVGASYATRTAALDISYPKSAAITTSGASEVVFDPLTARTTATTMTLSNGSKQYTLTLNGEGTIDW